MAKCVMLYPLWHAGLMGFRALAFLRADGRLILQMLFSESPHRRVARVGGALLLTSSILTFAVPVLRKSVRRGSYTYSTDHMQALGAARAYESTGRFLFHTDSAKPNIVNGVNSEKRLVPEQSTYYEPLLSHEQSQVLKQAREDADYFFATQDPAGATAILKKYDVSLVMETADAPLHFPPLSTWSLSYAGPTVRMYEIRP